MIKRLLFVLLLLISSLVAASVPPITLYRINTGVSTFDSWQNNPDGACSRAAAYWSQYNWGDATHVWTASYTVQSCTVDYSTVYTAGTKDPQFPAAYLVQPGTRSNSLFTKLGCAGDAAMVGGQCPDPPPDCSHSEPYNFTVSYGVQPPGGGSVGSTGKLPKSDGFCEITADKVLECRQSNTTGEVRCTYVVHRTGIVLQAAGGTDSGTPPSTDPRVNMPPSGGASGGKCPTGSVAAGVDSDGTTICMGTGSNPPAPSVPPTTTTAPPSTTTDANGTTTTTQATTQQNSDGSTTTITKTTVTAADGTVTTSQSATVSNTPSGVAGTTTPDKPPSDLCELHPDLSVCRNSSVSGSCGAIACVGDAIQCATLREAAIIECRQKTDSDALSALPVNALGQQILAGADPMKAAADAAIAGTTVDLSNPNLDSSGFLGGGSCLAPINLSFAGQAFSYSFDGLCSNIVPLRFAVMACASILAYLIFSRSILQG